MNAYRNAASTELNQVHTLYGQPSAIRNSVLDQRIGVDSVLHHRDETKQAEGCLQITLSTRLTQILNDNPTDIRPEKMYRSYSQPSLTRGQSNLTKSASPGAHSPVRGHPRGSKFVPLNSWGRVSY